ncbi:MAG: hypothetical protein HOY69_28600, partial [Streptomyces sp.]|nr:hypothetical protein [Streptomyces sp.]
PAAAIAAAARQAPVPYGAPRAVPFPAVTRRRLSVAAAALAVTVTAGIGIPVADAYSDAPSHHGAHARPAQEGRR